MVIDKRMIIFFFIGLLLINSVYAVSISPPRVEGNFKPGMETQITYTVSSGLNRYLEVYTKGDLAEYVTFNTTKIFKSGSFVVTLKLPETIEPPGPKRTYIGTRELVEEEIAAGAMGVAVGIEGSIIIHVPYPGKYLETTLSGHDTNLGEPITFKLNVISRGDEDLIMRPRIEVYSEQDGLIETLEFKEREVKSGESIELQKVLETTNYGAGRYYALSKVDYGERIAEANTSFRIGELVINIINYSNQIKIDGMQNFWVDIESGWNDKIDGAFADIMLSNRTKINLVSFRTSPTDLEPFQSGRINGYFDTDNFAPGKYQAKIELTYYGKDRGKSTTKDVEVQLIKPEEIDLFMVILITGVGLIGAIVLLILVVIIISKIKNARKKK